MLRSVTICGNGGTSRRYIALLCACLCVCAAAHAQQDKPATVPQAAPGVSEAPDFPNTPAIPDSPGTSRGGRQGKKDAFNTGNAPQHQRPQQTDDSHFAWGTFLTDATRAGFHFAVPRLSQSAEGPAGASFMGGSFSTPGAGNGMAGAGMHGGGGMRGGGNSLMDVSSGLLQSLGNSAGGSLGTTLHTLSSLTNSRTGYALSNVGTGVDFHVSGSMSNMMSAPSVGGSQTGGANAFGGMGGHGQNMRGPSLELKLKF